MGRTVLHTETHRRVIILLLCLLVILAAASGCLGGGSAAQAPTPSIGPATVSLPAPTGAPLASPLAEPMSTSVPSLLPTIVSPVLPLTSPLSTPEPSAAPICPYFVARALEHDRNAFTQGLTISGGVLFESTGLNGRSSLRALDLETGSTRDLFTLPDAYFGEGLTALDGRLIQLTWHSQTAFIYEETSFIGGPIGEFAYETEGWGLTTDGHYLIMSDGSAVLYFRDPGTFEVVHEIFVRDGAAPVDQLNELEFVRGFILANIWHSDRIAVIEPETGSVVCWLDLSGILEDQDRLGTEDVLNGIAYDPASDRLYVTGKLWPKIFEIDVVLP